MTMMNHEELFNHLKLGKKNVTSSYTLASRLGLNQKVIGFLVSDLRKDGALIGSIHGKGYYLIENEDELQETISHIEKRKHGIDQTLRTLQESWLNAIA